MRKPFDKDFTQTQGFNDECCRDSYKKFGLLGHNGLDFATPSGTKILAPHDGKVIEATLDQQGYGIYVKIENSIEGSVLAHLREYQVGVGDGVKEGDLIGYSDNSGNSTGPHLHWGYYRFPRDRKNGFAGFINQIPYINAIATVPVNSKTFENLVRKSTIYDRILEKLKDVQDNETLVLTEIDKLIQYEDDVVAKDKKIKDLEEKLSAVEAELAGKTAMLTAFSDKNKELEQHVVKLTEAVEESQKKIDSALADNSELSRTITELKSALREPLRDGWSLIWEGIRKLIGRR